MTTGAALIHAAVAPGHFAEWALFGVFFLAAAAAQLALAAIILVAPSPRSLAAAIAGNLGLVVLWAISRWTGLPVGPSPWHPETIGLADSICVAMESLAAAFAMVCLVTRPRPRRPLALTAAPVVILAAALSLPGISSGANAMVYAYNVAPLVPGAPQVPVTMLTEAPGSQPVRAFTLVAAPTRTGYAYNGTVPGPELRVRQGERVRVTLVNHLPVATTIHWHGMVLPNAMDGVAGVTQSAVAPGGSYVYEFVAQDAGTFWYHSHQDTSSQLAKGLYGALVVEPATGPAEERDYTALVHNLADGSVAVNGARGGLTLDASPGQTVRLRVINATVPGMDGSPIAPAIVGTPFRVAAFNGQDIADRGPVSNVRIPLGMGERADLVFTMPAAGAVRLAAGALQGELSGFQKLLLTFGVKPASQDWSVVLGPGDAPQVATAAWPLLDLAAYAGTSAAETPDVVEPLVLGERPGFRSGTVQLVHTLNGSASPVSPPIRVKLGQRVRLHIVNQTGEYHPMHLHGHVLQVSGSALRGDTVLVAPHATVDVDFTANNPGVWMLHCHVLLHAEMGMMTNVIYDGYGTPFEMGERSGNMPE